jgi:lipopolysaccharide export system permease protein
MPLLLLQKEKIRSQMLEGNSNDTLKQQDNMCTYEIMRRFSLGFAPLTFSLLGAAFGISLGREQTKKNLLIVIVLAAISCAAFFLAKSSSEGLTAPALMFFLPQLMMVAASIWKLDRDSKGIE